MRSIWGPIAVKRRDRGCGLPSPLVFFKKPANPLRSSIPTSRALLSSQHLLQPLDNMSHVSDTPRTPSTCNHIAPTWEIFYAAWCKNMIQLGQPCDPQVAVRAWELFESQVEMMCSAHESPEQPLDHSNEDEDEDLFDLSSPYLLSESSSLTAVSSPASDEHPTYQPFSAIGELPSSSQQSIDAAPTPLLYPDVGQLQSATLCPGAGGFHVAGPSSIHTDAPLHGHPSLVAPNYFPALSDPLPDNWWEQFPDGVLPNTGHNAPGLFAPENTPAFQLQNLSAGLSNDQFAADFGEHVWGGVQNAGSHCPLSGFPNATTHPTTFAPHFLSSPIPPVPPLPTPADAHLPLPDSAGQFGQDAGAFISPQLLKDIASILEQCPPQQNTADPNTTEVIIRNPARGSRVTVSFE